jgi:hypothetical protein
LDGPTLNVISIFAKTAFQMTRLDPKSTKVIPVINRGWAQSTMETKSIAIHGSKTRGVES